MLFGMDGVEVGILIVFLTLFAGIMTGFPVAFAIAGAGVISFAIIAALDSAGLLIHQAIDKGSAEFAALVAEGVARDAISVFRYPDLPRIEEPVFPRGWEQAMERNISFIVNRINERVIAGQSIETLLAVLMFVMMGITLERSRIAEDLLTSMARVFGPLPGGLAVSIVIVGAFLAASTGIVGATVVTMGLLALPTMLRNNYSPELATGVIAASGTLGQIIPPSIVIVLLGTLVGDLYATGQETRAVVAGCTDALTFLGEPAVLSVGTLFQAALLPGLFLAFLYGLYAFGFALLRPASAPPVQLAGESGEVVTRNEALTWYLAAPVGTRTRHDVSNDCPWGCTWRIGAFSCFGMVYLSAWHVGGQPGGIIRDGIGVCISYQPWIGPCDVFCNGRVPWRFHNLFSFFIRRL